LRAVAILIFFAAATRTGVVSAYFLFIANGLCPLDLARIFNRIVGCACTGRNELQLGRLHTRLLLRLGPRLADILWLLVRDLSLEKETNDVLIHADQHLLE